MSAKQHVLVAVLFGVFAAAQAVVGYSYDYHGHTSIAVAFYLVAVIASGFAIRAWGRRHYYP